MNQFAGSECYCTSLRRSAGLISSFYDDALKETGLTAAQYHLLIHLSRAGSANITQWSGLVGLDRSTMVRNIRPLLSRGLIQEADGRGRVFTLSSGGQALLTAARPLWEKAQNQIESVLGSADTDSILRISRKLEVLQNGGSCPPVQRPSVPSSSSR